MVLLGDKEPYAVYMYNIKTLSLMQKIVLDLEPSVCFRRLFLYLVGSICPFDVEACFCDRCFQVVLFFTACVLVVRLS